MNECENQAQLEGRERARFDRTNRYGRDLLISRRPSLVLREARMPAKNIAPMLNTNRRRNGTSAIAFDSRHAKGLRAKSMAMPIAKASHQRPVHKTALSKRHVSLVQLNC
jgi:hypothetical protein